MVCTIVPGRGFLVAISFLTRIPLHHRHSPNISQAALWFPLVGMLVGAIAGLTAFCVGSLSNSLLGAACGVAVGLLITGAFHEDGLADVADAFVGGWTVEERLRIMKDPRHGTYGVAVLCMSIIFRVVAIGSVAIENIFVAFIFAHGLARCAALFMMLTGRLSRHEGLGADYTTNLSRAGSICVLAVASATTIFWFHWYGLILLGVAAMTTIVMRWWSKRKIGGISGDVLGANEQAAEVMLAVVLATI